MEEQMKLMIDLLKERIKSNLQIIGKNEENIRGILLQPVSNERSALLKENFNINRKLLEENRDSLSVELQLINYLGKFREALKHQNKNRQSLSEIDDEINNLENESYQNDDNSLMDEINEDVDILNLTLLGEIPFNSNHPKFNDEEFFESLLERYKQTENYEMCSYILGIKGRK